MTDEDGPHCIAYLNQEFKMTGKHTNETYEGNVRNDLVVEKLLLILRDLEKEKKDEKQKQRIAGRRSRQMERQRRTSQERRSGGSSVSLTPSRSSRISGISSSKRSRNDSTDDDDIQDGVEEYYFRAFRKELQKYFVLLPKSAKAKMARQETYGATLRRNMAKYVENDRYIVSIMQNITMSDLVLPDHVGWLTDQSSKSKVWCVVADMLFCVFVNKEYEKPRDVVLLPGCTVRALVFKSAAYGGNNEHAQLCKTISGLDKYQLVLENGSTKNKFLFSAETRSEIDQWTTILKGASTLDTDLFESDDEEDGRKKSVHSSESENEKQRPLYSLRYLPSLQSLNRRDKMSQSKDQSTLSVNGTEGEKRNSVQCSLSGSLHINGADVESLGDFRKYLRRETKYIDSELLKPSPVKAMHFETSSSERKKSGPMKLLKRFGSLENIFKPKKDRSPNPSRSTDESVSIGSAASVDFSSSVDFRRSRPRQKQCLNRRSHSLDRNDHSNGSASIMDFRRKKSSASHILLSDLNDIRYCGYLQYKAFLKWQTLWCVVCKGCFYGFRSQSHNEAPRVSVVLTHCQVSYVSDQEKRQKKLYVFKLTHSNVKNMYFNASDHRDLSYWLQVLQMEANKIQRDEETRFEGRGFVSELSFDSLLSSTSVSSNNDHSSSEPSVFATSDDSFDSRNSIIFDDLQNLPHAKTNHTSFSSDHTEYDTSSTDDWDNESMTNACELGRSYRSPHHDMTLKHLWQKDSGYLLNVIRTKLRKRRKQSGDSPENKIGCGNDDLLVVEDEEPKSICHKNEQRSSSRSRARKSCSFGTRTDLIMEDGGDGKSSVSPTPLRKRHKPLVVKRIAAHELVDHDLSGYMERKSFSGQWIRYWYIMKNGSLYCYLTPDDTVTVDIVDLPGYQVTCMLDKFRGKRFIVMLSHSLYTSNYLSVDTREEMAAWESCLKRSIGKSHESILNPVILDNDADPLDGAVANGGVETDHYWKRQAIKQRLLEEMLRQKHQLEQKQAARQKKQHNWQKSDTLNPRFTANDQLLSDVTRLRQRRLSAQLKVETIQKQLQNTNGPKKKLFSFGHKKPKQPEHNNNQRLEDQLKEFAEKIERLDKDLDQCKKGSSMEQKHTMSSGPVKSTSNDDLNKRLEVMSLECQQPVSNDASVQRTNSLKASMQKFAHKTFLKGGRNKSNKKTTNGTDAVANGEIPDTLKTDAMYCSPMISFEEEEQDDEQDSGYGLADHDSDSVTDLTKDITPQRFNENCNDNHFDLSIFDSLNSPRTSPRLSRSRKMGANRMSASPEMSSPRRQIDPNVLAEIDAFEELTRQVLSSRGELLPTT